MVRSDTPGVSARPKITTRSDAPTLIALAGTAVVSSSILVMVLRGRPIDAYYWLYLLHNGPPGVVLLWVGRLVLQRRPDNGAGRLLLALGALCAAHMAFGVATDVGLAAEGVDDLAPATAEALVPAALPLSASLPLFVISWWWVLPVTLTIVGLPLLFPDGELVGRGSRRLVVVAGAGATAVAVGVGSDAWPTLTRPGGQLPLWGELAISVGGLVVTGCAVVAFAGLLRRARRASPEDRRSYQVVGIAALLFALITVASYPWPEVWIPATLVAFLGLLVAYGLAVARYRLHDVEPFLGRAALAGVLSLLVAGVYATVVLGVGTVVRRPGDDVVLPMLALVAVALMAEPVHRRSRRLIDQRIYRTDKDRIEVLSRVAARANSSTAGLLDEVTELLLRSTGAERVEASLAPDLAPAAAAGHTTRTRPVLTSSLVHQGERLGELRLYAGATADLVGDAPELVADVGHALGIALRNDRLTSQLRQRLDDLEASRRRLVEAHETGRRSLERDIHDGTQTRLIALRLRIGVLRALVSHQDPRVDDELEALGRDVDAAVRSLRDLARGLAPPLLEESGPAAALRAHSRDLPIPVQVIGTGDARHPAPVEGAVYFCCLEALQNAVRHSEATTVVVDVHSTAHEVRFRVTDDGVGFDAQARRGNGLTNIDDRVRALGGWTIVESAPGGGTVVAGEVPVEQRTAERHLPGTGPAALAAQPAPGSSPVVDR